MALNGDSFGEQCGYSERVAKSENDDHYVLIVGTSITKYLSGSILQIPRVYNNSASGARLINPMGTRKRPCIVGLLIQAIQD